MTYDFPAFDNILNYLPITEKIATSGQPCREDFQAIAKGGYSTVINLGMPDAPDAIAEEGQLVTALGMNYIHLPIPFHRPELHHAYLFNDIMQAFKHQKVWVHCVKNYRVSAFMFHYSTHYLGMSVNQAKSNVQKIWQANEVWRAFIAMKL